MLLTFVEEFNRRLKQTMDKEEISLKPYFPFLEVVLKNDLMSLHEIRRWADTCIELIEQPEYYLIELSLADHHGMLRLLDNSNTPPGPECVNLLIVFLALGVENRTPWANNASSALSEFYWKLGGSNCNNETILDLYWSIRDSVRSYKFNDLSLEWLNSSIKSVFMGCSDGRTIPGWLDRLVRGTIQKQVSEK